MIISALSLHTSSLMAHNSMNWGMNFQNNSNIIQKAQNNIAYKIATTQIDSCQKLLNKNIKNSFNIFA